MWCAMRMSHVPRASIPLSRALGWGMDLHTGVVCDNVGVWVLCGRTGMHNQGRHHPTPWGGG